jgi:hypothetical protein
MSAAALASMPCWPPAVAPRPPASTSRRPQSNRPSGVFHVFSDENRPRYVASLAGVLRTGGTLYLMCFSDQQPGDFGPRRVRQDELRAAFTDDWAVQSITADTCEIRPVEGTTRAQAWLAVFTRR